jgi:hypothetical protein
MIRRPGPVQTSLEIVSLGQLVPADHLLRKIEAAIDFSFIHDLTAPLYCADNGRPLLDPTLMFTALFVGYLFGSARSASLSARSRSTSPIAGSRAPADRSGVRRLDAEPEPKAALSGRLDPAVDFRPHCRAGDSAWPH